MKRRIFTLLTCGIFAFNSYSQETIPCATSEALEHLHQMFPELKAEYDLNVLLNNSRVKSEVGVSSKKTTSYIIPVVFHILHEYGSENISDASVYALMEDLNKDYSATNADLSQVIPMFDTIIGNPQIEFRLAAIDPYGNCTNGIEHIYTHETNNGESVSKMNQWNRSHYMNVWVVAEPNSGGPIQGVLLGYATFPIGTDGSGFWTDGVVLRDYTVTNNDRTLTHEGGHYLGLSHPFDGVASVGDPSECGDDGVLDTPPTQGSFSTCNLSLPTCDTLVAQLPLANVQNIMDYSSCSVMFTEQQVNVMHNTLQGISGQRNILWQDTTLMETGVMNATMPQTALTVPRCTPIADFNSPDRTVCTGSNVSFIDASYNAVIDDWAWTFEDATPPTSSSINPTVTFSTPGWKQVTLTVSNITGADTKSDSKYIYVSPNWPENIGPTTFDMENTGTFGNGTNFFLVQNSEKNHGEFKVVNNNGYNGTKAFKLNTFKDISQADNFTSEWFYNMRLGGSVDALITPSIDLRNTSGVTVTFKYAYATNATVTADITEQMRVYTSKNCGESWTPRVLSVDGVTIGSTITEDDLVTAGYASNSDFAPTSNLMWKTGSFTYLPSSADRLTRIKFEFTASDLSSNLYIDDINILGVLGILNQEIIDLQLVVFPNPSHGEAITVNYFAQDEPTEFILRDIQGKIISQQVIEGTNTQISQQLENTENLTSACYFLEVRTGDYSTIRKVVVM